MAFDYGTLKARIASELHRTDLTSDIVSHVLSAVAFYATDRFYGNEKQWTLTTIAGTKYYGPATSSPGTLPTDLVEIDSITATISSRVYRLDPTTFSHMEDIDGGNTTLSGYPREWAPYKGQIRLYPTPNGAYTLTISGQCTLTALSADTDSNFWTSDAEPLIRARAKRTLYLDVMEDEQGAARQAALEREYLSQLKKKTAKFIAAGRLDATRF